MSDRLSIVFVLPALTFGGAERVMLTLLAHLDRERFAPVLAVGAAQGQFARDVPTGVPVVELGGARARRAVPGLVRLVRRLRPRVVFSTLGYLNVLVMLARGLMPRSTTFIGRETNIPSLHLPRSGWPRLLPLLYRRLYPRFDRVVCQSEDMRRDLVEAFGLPAARAVVINNPVDVDAVAARAARGGAGLPPGRINVLAAGQLTAQPGFDLLREALARSGDPALHLTILGEGPERAALEARACELGLAGRVALPGFAADPCPAMAGADLFVLSSRYEGFPNVVLEAMACGTPVLAFDCPGGLAEIVRQGENGWLVSAGDVAALAAALPERARTALNPEAVRATVRDRYGAAAVAARYAALFEAVARGGEGAP